MAEYNWSKPRLARDIMVKNLVTIEPQTPAIAGILALVQSKVKGAPVTSPDRTYHGIFTERCCLNVLMTCAESASWSELFPAGEPVSADIMNRNLMMLPPDMDVFEAVGLLLSKRISGAPVINGDGCFLGVFSEKSSMDVLIGAVYDCLPTTQVDAFMDTDRNRTIDESLELKSIVKLFLETPYRRLPVLRENRVVGQISRQDALRAMMGWFDRFAENRPAAASEATETFMDADAGTIAEEVDIFSIATIFRAGKFRRLPVVENGLLRGLITRKNLLQAANDLIEPVSVKKAQPLYLTSFADARPPDIR